MLEKILESKTQSNVLAFFLVNPERCFYAGELEKRIGGKNLPADLRALQHAGILDSYPQRGVQRYYQMNRKMPHYQQLRSSVSKNFASYEDELIKSIKKLTGIRCAVLSGIFMGLPKMECDILLVGEVSKRQLDNFIIGAEKIIGQEVNYAVMDEKEFAHRKDTFDRFMKDMYENRHIVVVDKIKSKG